MNKDAIKRQALRSKHLRIRKKISGSAARPRLAVYRSERHIYGQLIDDESGRTILSASSISRELRDGLKDKKPGDQAQTVGEHLAEKAVASGINQVVFDRGGRRYAGRLARLADGARSKGLQF